MTGLQIQMAVQGKLREYDHAVAASATVAIRTVTSRMKSKGRRQMTRAGLGHRLPNAFRGTVYSAQGADITRRGIDPNPTGIVASQAFIKRPSGTVDLIDVFEQGTIVIPRRGNFLAMPTKEAGGRRAQPMTAYPDTTFRLVPYRKRGGRNPPSFLAIHKARGEVWYLLYPSVHIRKRLELNTLYTQQAATVPALLDASWAKAVAKLEA